MLVVLLCVLGGLGWLVFALATGRLGGGEPSEAPASSSSPRALPASSLDRVAPSPTDPRTPTPTPVAVGQCTDDMIGLAVRAPATVAVGTKPTFELVVRNTSRVPCVRELDTELQEIVLLDGGGTRLWGSNDCFPEAGPDTRRLAPGAAVSFSMVWGGLTSEPTCTAARGTPAPGSYLLRGRLDTETSPDPAITLR